MPIFVRWKWQERTKTYLVIFYFCDDFSKPNLRIKMRRIDKSSGWLWSLDDAKVKKDLKGTWSPVMTWAPAHVDVGLLGDLLRYANIIDGLPEYDKRELRRNLELFVEEEGKSVLYEADISNVISNVPDAIKMFGFLVRDVGEESFFCVELVPEYIDYLKKVLKPHIHI